MTPRLVVDASAALRLVLALEGANELAEQISDAAVVIVPELYASEVANALWKYVRAGDLGFDNALARLDEALALPDEFVPDRELAVEALAEAAHRGHPAYDLVYVALSRRHGARLVTRDEPLASLAQEMGVRVA